MPLLPDRPFQASDLVTLGISPKQLRLMLDQGQVLRVLQGVYVAPRLPDTIELRAAAAALVLPPHAVLCERTAAWLHGVDCLDLREHEVVPPLEVVSLRGRTRVRRTGTDGGTRDLTEHDICVVNGVRVTTPLRTACDLACLRGRRTALATLDAFMRCCGLTLQDFHRILPRYRGRRGVKQLRELVAYATPESESAGESWTRMTIIDAGLPAPQLQVWVFDGARPTYRLDLAYPLLKIAVEYDGQEHHSTDEQRAADLARRAWLRDRGWIVIVVRKDDFTGDSCDRWLAELKAALRERTPVRNRRYSRGESWGGN